MISDIYFHFQDRILMVTLTLPISSETQKLIKKLEDDLNPLATMINVEDVGINAY